MKHSINGNKFTSKAMRNVLVHCIIFIEKYANLFSICKLRPYPNYIYAYCFVLFNTNDLS